MQESPRENPLGTRPIGKLIASYAIPSIISMVVNALYNIVDQIFIGHDAGYLGNGATTVAFPLITMGLAISLLLGSGCAAFVSLKLGEHRAEEANIALGNMTTMLLLISVVFTGASLLFMEPILRVLGATDAILPYAIDYTTIIMIGQPFVILTTGFSNAIRADGSPRYSMMSMVVGAVINTILDPIFIFGLGLSVKGAAQATVISQVISFVLTAVYFLRWSKTLKLRARYLRLHGKVVGRVMALGLSSFITQASSTVLQIVMNNSLRYYGGLSEYGSEIPISGMGIVMKVSNIMISILVGISIGAQPILGFNYGAGQYHRVKKAYGIAAAAATIIGAVCWAAFMLFPRAFIAVFGDNTPAFVDFCVKCFRSFMALMFVAGFQIISANYFQAVGHPAKAILLTMSRQILLLIPLMLLLGSLFGLDGVLWSGAAADGLSVLLSGVFILLEMRRLKRLALQSE